MIVRPIVCRRFIGRDEELAYLHERRREASAARGGLVLVSGEAGVGKSRLLAEFRTSLAQSRARVGTGGCLEFAPRPYGPILDMIARFDASADPGPTNSKVERFDALADVLLREAARSTIALVVEDVHWADAATLDFLGYFASRIESARVLLVVSYRSEALRPGHPVHGAIAKLARASRAGRIDLRPLEGPEMRRFIDEALAGTAVPRDTLRAIARASDGNPLFIEELLKGAVEHGAGSGRAGVPIPATVRAALLERLEPLEREERRILAHAAVIGRSFDLELLAQTLDTVPAALLGALRRARDLQLVEERSPERFRFRHALTREAIYGDFLGAERHVLHAKIAHALEALPPERRTVESLAYHWAAAGDRDRAATYGEAAGDAAASVYANDDAIAAYERALAVTPAESPARVRLLEKLAKRYVMTGYNDRAHLAYVDAADMLRRANLWEREAECRARAAVQAYRLGFADPDAPLVEMLERLGPGERAARGRLHLGIAHVASLRYRTSVARSHLDAVDADVVARDADARYTYHATRATVLYIDGEIEAFREAIGAWHAASLEASDASLAGLVHFNGGMYLSILGLHDEAKSHFARALEVAAERRDRMTESAARAMSAMALLATGDLAGVRDAVDAVRALPTDSEVAVWHAAAWGTLAGLYLDDDRLIAQWFDDVEARITPTGAVIYAAGFAEIMNARGRVAEARALLHRALDFGERPRGMYMTLLAVARFGDESDFAQARAKFERAAEATGEVVERFGVALFDAYVARRAGDGARAAELAESAVDGFRRLRYPLLEAAALELAARPDEALDVYRRVGAVREVRRLAPLRIVVPSPSAAAVPFRRSDGLSTRETEIARLVAHGRSNVDIGRELAISHKTVEKHLGSIYQKLGFSSRTQLAAYVTRGDDASEAART